MCRATSKKFSKGTEWPGRQAVRAALCGFRNVKNSRYQENKETEAWPSEQGSDVYLLDPALPFPSQVPRQ